MEFEAVWKGFQTALQENTMAYTGAPNLTDSEEVLLQKLLSALGGTPLLGATEQQTLYNLVSAVTAGIAGGSSGFVVKTGDTMTGTLTAPVVAAASGTLVASAPAVLVSQTWNNGAVTFTGILGAYTLSAAGSNSNLINLTIDGVDRFNFTSGGTFRVVKIAADNSGPAQFLRKRGATGDATAALAMDASICSVNSSGWDGSAYQTGNSIISQTTEAWTGSVRGTYMDFQTTTGGTTSLVSTLKLQGNKIGFLATTPVVKQTSGANLTNNVTAGGTDDTIANYTDLTTYANDAAAIRNDIYQLSRKLKQVNDALRAYGLLT